MRAIAGRWNPRESWRLPVLAAAGISCVLLALAAWTVLNRVGAPVEYDWVESAGMVSVRRVLDGQGLYVAPSLEYASLPYGPVYYWLSALACLLLGEGFLAPRLLSAAALAGSIVLLFWIVRRETGSALAAVTAAGLFAGLGEMTHFSTDMARVDSLCVALVLLAAFLVRFHAGGNAALAGAAAASMAAVFTKQTAWIPVAAMGGWLLATRPRRGLAFSLSLLGLLAAAHLAYARATDGWFWFWLYEAPASHPRIDGSYARFFRHELLAGLGIGAAASLYGLLPASGDDAGRRRACLFHGLLVLAMGVATLLPRVKAGGSVNNLIPLCAAVSLGAGLGLGRALRRGPLPAAAAGTLLLVFGLQHLFPPGRYIPSPAAREAARSRRNTIRSLPQGIFAPGHGHLALQAGKGPSVFWPAMLDVLLTGEDDRIRLRPRLQEALLAKRYPAVVLNRGGYGFDHFPRRELDAAYQILRPQDYPRRGWLECPSLDVYVPKD